MQLLRKTSRFSPRKRFSLAALLHWRARARCSAVSGAAGTASRGGRAVTVGGDVALEEERAAGGTAVSAAQATARRQREA